MKPIEFGDWSVEWLDEEHGWIIDERGTYIVEVVTGDSEGRFFGSRRRREAAANLMAAAPKLLRALKRLRTDPSAWKEADAAIAEAESGGEGVVA